MCGNGILTGMVLYRTERIRRVLLRGRTGCYAVAVGTAAMRTPGRRPTEATALRRTRTAPSTSASALSGPCQNDHAVTEIGRAG